jgi:hypothetical protein
MKKHISWGHNYGKTFKIVKTPEGRQEGGEWSPDLVSVVTPENGDAWTDWEELDPVRLKSWKNNWNQIQKNLGDYKYNQIIRSQERLNSLHENINRIKNLF